jgi:HPt (histidine-containing phosphotransfer) domain-containing protein
MRETIGGADFAAIARVAHRIKGASRMIGAQPYADVAERMERAARNADRAALDDTLDDFEHELARLTEYLQNETAAA